MLPDSILSAYVAFVPGVADGLRCNQPSQLIYHTSPAIAIFSQLDARYVHSQDQALEPFYHAWQQSTAAAMTGTKVRHQFSSQPRHASTPQFFSNLLGKAAGNNLSA